MNLGYRTYIYTQLPSGFWGFIDEETRQLVTDPFVLAHLREEGRRQFPGYEEEQRTKWLAEVAELERIASL